MADELLGITPDMFERAEMGEFNTDAAFKTEPRGYFKDAFYRFKKNKSSVAAAIIISLLVLFALLSPVISPYTVYDKNNVYTNLPPYSPRIASLGLGILDGSRRYMSMNERDIERYRAIAAETGYDPAIGGVRPYEVEEKHRGQIVKKTYYSLKVNSYFAVGARLMNISYSEFEDIQRYQNESGLQVLLPYVVGVSTSSANSWYKINSQGSAILDENGNFINNYSTDVDSAGPIAYTSMRIEGDDGSYVYSRAKSGSLNVRVSYYNY